MSLRLSTYPILSLGFFLLSPDLLMGQYRPGIGGSVLTPKGQPLADVTILLEGPVVKWTSSDTKGEFEFVDIPYGDYKITVSMLGYNDEDIVINYSEAHTQALIIELSESIDELETVIISTASEAAIEEKKGYEVASISAQDLHTQSIESNQLLARVPGVAVRQQGGLGSRSDIYVNGLGGRAIRIFLDGIPMDYFGSSYSLNTLPISQIDRIDVYKGVVPVQLGNDALGGAINIVTKRSFYNTAELSYSYGSFNTHRVSLLASGRSQQSGFSANVSAFLNYSDNSYQVWGEDIYLTNPETFEITRGIKATRFHDTFQSQSLKTEVGYTEKHWADRLFLGVLLSHLDKDLQHGATMEVPFGKATYDQSVAMPYLTYQKENMMTDGLHLNFFSAWSDLTRNRVDTSRQIYNWLGQIEGLRVAGGEQSRTLNSLQENAWLHRLNISYQWTPWLNANLNVVASDLKRTDDDPLINTQQKTEGYYAPQYYDKLNIGFSIQGEWLEKRLNATMFIKHFGFDATIRQTTYEGGTETYTSVNRTASEVALGMAGSYQFSEKVQMNTSVSSAVRLPEPDELLGDGLLIENNPDLQPESSNNINLGVRIDLLEKPRQAMHLSANGFYRMVTNRIQQTFSTQFEGQFVYENIGKVSMTGADLQWVYEYNEWMSLDQSVSYLHPVIQTEKDIFGNDNILKGTRLSNVPFFQTGTNLRLALIKNKWEENRLSFYWNFRFVGEFFRNSEEIGQYGRDKIPAQFVHSTGLGYTLPAKGLSLSLDLINVFDRQLFDDFAIQKPGRAVFIKLTYSISKKS